MQERPSRRGPIALAHSTFKSIRDIPPAGNPDTNEAKRGDQTDHLRGVTRLAIGIAEEMGAAYPELAIDMDVVIAGGLVTMSARPGSSIPPTASAGRHRRGIRPPSIRHPAYGAHICLTVGLPEEVAHIAMAHSGEGELLVRSLECMIVHQADYTFWNTLLAGGHSSRRRSRRTGAATSSTGRSDQRGQPRSRKLQLVERADRREDTASGRMITPREQCSASHASI